MIQCRVTISMIHTNHLQCISGSNDPRAKHKDISETDLLKMVITFRRRQWVNRSDNQRRRKIELRCYAMGCFTTYVDPPLMSLHNILFSLFETIFSILCCIQYAKLNDSSASTHRSRYMIFYNFCYKLYCTFVILNPISVNLIPRNLLVTSSNVVKHLVSLSQWTIKCLLNTKESWFNTFLKARSFCYILKSIQDECCQTPRVITVLLSQPILLCSHPPYDKGIEMTQPIYHGNHQQEKSDTLSS